MDAGSRHAAVLPRLSIRVRPCRVRPWMCVLGLLVLCAVKGIWFTAGMDVPPDEDIVRDLGFIQGLLDGNWFGDPINAGALRWYPPLLHVLAAGMLWLCGADPLTTWVGAGAWLNLLCPLLFWLMSTRLIGAWPAVAATAMLVLFNGSTMSGDEAISYTPWTLTPSLGWSVFFGGVWLLAGRVPALRWRDALPVGSFLGAAFLAHTVPAVLLSAVAAGAVVGTHGLRVRGLTWLVLIAGVEVAWSVIFLGPLAFTYRLHIANPVPGAWVHGLLAPEAVGRMLLLNLPGLLALPALRLMSGQVRGIMLAWIGTCVLFLARHYACAGNQAGVCGMFVIAPHHYHVYLQGAWAVLIGLALVRGLERDPSTSVHRSHFDPMVGQSGNSARADRAMAVQPRTARFVLAGAAITLGTIGLYQHTPDLDRRAAVRGFPDAVLDREAYRWILAHTGPRDLFATSLPAEPDRMGATVATVFAAGRRLVAPPAVHGNPYLAWPPLDARRRDYLAGGDSALCRFVAEAGPGATAWFLLPVDAASPVPSATFRTAWHALYRVNGAGCPTNAVPIMPGSAPPISP